MWILTLKEKYSTKKFVFDPGGILDLSTLEDGHDSRTNHFEERGNDVNTSMTRNLNPIRIQENDENPSTTRNPSLTRIQDIIRNPYPARIEDPLTYDGILITWACAKKMKEALHMLIKAIWAQSTKLNHSYPYGAHGINFGPKLIHLVQIEDLGPNNVIGSNLDSLSPKE